MAVGLPTLGKFNTSKAPQAPALREEKVVLLSEEKLNTQK